MREILFRGKREEDGGWIYGLYSDDYVYDTDFPCIVPLRSGAIYDSWAVIRDTVGQYTGLTDKNGTKIFEGDIVNVAYNPKYTGISKDRIGNFEVVFNNGCFMKGSIQNNGLYHFIPSDETTVIGNIYDNPDLLKGE